MDCGGCEKNTSHSYHLSLERQLVVWFIAQWPRRVLVHCLTRTFSTQAWALRQLPLAFTPFHHAGSVITQRALQAAPCGTDGRVESACLRKNTFRGCQWEFSEAFEVCSTKKKQQSTSDRGVGRQLTVPGPHSGRLALFVASLVVCCESRVQNTVVAADDRDFYLITKRQVARNVQKCYDTVERKAVAFFKRFTRNPPMRWSNFFASTPRLRDCAYGQCFKWRLKSEQKPTWWNSCVKMRIVSIIEDGTLHGWAIRSIMGETSAYEKHRKCLRKTARTLSRRQNYLYILR